MVRSKSVCLALTALTLGGQASIEEPLHAQQAACSAPEHRLFDFWQGEWEVRRADGTVAGRNVIRSTLAGCVLREHYTTAAGYEGESFNVYDGSRGVWHQTWVDNRGLLLLLDGAFHDGKMVLEGEGRDGSGPLRHRITWNRIDGDPDRVRQLWETSRNGGATWVVAFDGTYVREGHG